MSSLFEERAREPEDQPVAPPQAPSRDLTLGTGSLLAIFFGLILLAAVIFGIGYRLGHHGPDAPTTPANTADTAPLAGTGAAKPSANGGTQQPQPQTTQDTSAAPAESTPEPAAKPDSVTVSTPVHTNTAPTPVPVQQQPAKLQSPTPSKPAANPPSTAAAAGSYMVQVAAVSHDEDAEVLVSSLKKRGYSVVLRHEPQDKLSHVQVGPFNSKDEAKAMQQKLLHDGYAAILKP